MNHSASRKRVVCKISFYNALFIGVKMSYAQGGLVIGIEQVSVKPEVKYSSVRVNASNICQKIFARVHALYLDDVT